MVWVVAITLTNTYFPRLNCVLSGIHCALKLFRTSIFSLSVKLFFFFFFKD